MATNDRLHKFASTRMTKWSKRQLPGYWPALQVLCVVGFGLFLAIRLIGGGGGDPAVVATAKPAPPVPSSTTAPADPGSTTAPTAQPTTPQTQEPINGATSGPTVDVMSMTGATVAVPEGAAQVATAGLQALFDPAVAATVPAAGGGTVPVPARAFPDASIGALVVFENSADRVTFTASTDADGPSATFAPADYTITVVLDGGSWAVDLS